MSYLSQVTNARSMNGLVTFDDGNGGVLENGQLNANRMVCPIFESGVMSVNNIELKDYLKVNNVEITSTWLSYLSGLTSNVQQQINDIITNHLITNNIWTGINTFLNKVFMYNNLDVSGNVYILGNLSGTTIDILNDSISQNTSDICENSIAISQNTSDISENTSDIFLLFDKVHDLSNGVINNTFNILQNISDIIDLSNNVLQNTNNINGLQTQVTTINNTPKVQTLNIGTVTSVVYEGLSSVVNSGTATNQVLDFVLQRGPRGFTGPQGGKGDQGDRGPKGDDGSDGSDGSQGPPGDTTGATLGAAAAATAATAAGVSAAASAGSAATAAGSASAAAASAAAANTRCDALDVKMNIVETDVDQLQLDSSQLKTKTQNITGTAGNTIISGRVECGNLVSNSTIYATSDITSTGKIISNDGFSGGLTSTRITGPNINIGASEILGNSITIGAMGSAVQINGFVTFSNSFGAKFISQLI